MNTHQLPDWLQQAKTIAIVGFGREGQSTYRFLRRYLSKEIRINVYDENDQALKQWNGETVKILNFRNISLPEDVIFKTPGIPLSAMSNQLSAHVTSQADLFMQLFGPQTIGVTGTKGKSTTSHVISHLLENVGLRSIFLGNIGSPAFDHVEEITAETIVVFELSSFQCESLQMAPQVSVFTSLYQDHLDYYSTFQEYKAAKKHLFELQTETDFCLYRCDDPLVAELVEALPMQKISYSGKQCGNSLAWIEHEHIYTQIDGKDTILADLKELQIHGIQNQVNCLPAILIGCFYNPVSHQIDMRKPQFSPEKLIQALLPIPPLAGRLELIQTVNDVRFFDDNLATIPEATMAALDTLGRSVKVLLVGGHDRHQDYQKLAERIVQSDIKTLIAFPTTGKKIVDLVKETANKIEPDYQIEVYEVTTMQEAVTTAYAEAKRFQSMESPSPIVLLSTAAPSFGTFRDYADRSRQYKLAIESLAGV